MTDELDSGGAVADVLPPDAVIDAGGADVPPDLSPEDRERFLRDLRGFMALSDGAINVLVSIVRESVPQYEREVLLVRLIQAANLLR